MPTYCFNKVAVTGPPKSVAILRNLIVKDYEEEEFYGKFVEELIPFPKHDLGDIREGLTILPNGSKLNIWRQEHSPNSIPRAITDEEINSLNVKYGCYTPIDWKNINWGSLRPPRLISYNDSYKPDLLEVQQGHKVFSFSFTSENGIMLEAVRTIARKLQLDYEHFYADPGLDACGFLHVRNDNIIQFKNRSYYTPSGRICSLAKSI